MKSMWLIAAAAGGALSLSGCETVAEVVAPTFRTNLTGGQQVPGPGDPDGSGTAEISVDTATAQVCWDLNWTNIDQPTAAHVHRGAAGTSGPPVVTLSVDTDGESDGCTAVDRALATEIVATPANFYVNVHNAPYPNGAIRGQLRR